MCAGTASEMTVVASAPGKVILFGEHAVVYGKTAVGAAVSDLRIVVEATCTEEASLVLDLPDLGVTFRKTAQEVATAFGFPLVVAAQGEAAPPGPAHLDLISAFVGDDEGWSDGGKKALVPLIFLVLALVPRIFLGKAGPGAQGLTLKAYSASLPVGAGLGSSAALCVATAAALTRLSADISRGAGVGGGVTPADNGDGDGGGKSASAEQEAGAAAGEEGTAGGWKGDDGGARRPSPTELKQINSWAFAGETVLHGTPSGLDNTVSCYGGAIKFIKGMGGAGNTTEPIPGFPPLPILLTNTLVPKDTRALVAGVRRLLEAHGAPTSATFDAIGAIASEFLERAAAAVTAPAEGEGGGDVVNSGESTEAATGAAVTKPGEGPSPLTAECVGELAEMNHRLLCALGVSHPALERVCEVARRHKCSSKLTGAGGGGCALTILSGEGLSEASLVQDMAAEGFKCYETSLGGDGVLWHGATVPPELAAPSKRAAAAAATGSSSSTMDAESEGSGLAGRFVGRHRKVVGIAAMAVAVAVISVAPALFAGFGRRGSRW
ncbi:unnamed protein product [Scytosiphon promiscuus]